MIGMMRLILASSALIIIYIDPSEPDRLVQVTYASLVGYVVYSLALYLISQFQPGTLSWLSTRPWVDVAWYVVLVALSSGTNSVFFFFFFFPILISSFSGGFKSGLHITIACAISFTVVGFLTAPDEPHFQLNRFLLRPVYLMVLGYMIAYWGGHETKLKERLRFLREISRFSNPRFGVDHTVNWMMERARAFYDADSVLIVFGDPNRIHFKRVTRNQSAAASGSQLSANDLTELFVSGSADEALISNGPGRNWVYKINRGEMLKDNDSRDGLTRMIESDRFLSIPINHRGRAMGRCYVVGGPSRYSSFDVDFLLQAIEQVLPVIDNIRLVDHLASDAAEREREKIARDIHDSVIQPYIGFQLGLIGIIQKLERNDADVVQRSKELAELTAKGITDLRRYMRGMRDGEAADNSLLLTALRRFASKFSQATGIAVRIDGSESLGINDRLAGEIFQMVNEGLSNVRRHSNAEAAIATLVQENGNLVVQIENDHANGPVAKKFHPKSLAERAADLGGDLTVEINSQITTVRIQIPL